MESNFKLSRREKTGLVARYLRGCWGYFLAAILFACLSMALNALTPQVIRLTVDSILDDQAPALPAWLLSRLDWAVLRAEPGRALLWAAGAVLLIALVRGLCSYVQRIQLARGSESFVKGIRDDLYRHIQHLSFAWHKNNPTGESSAAPLTWMSSAALSAPSWWRWFGRSSSSSSISSSCSG